MDKKTVKIIHRNAQMKPIGETEYDFEDYTQMIRLDLLKIITDIEDLIYDTTDGKLKHEWPDTVMQSFNRIKHRLLDKAGEIARLPETLQIEAVK